MAPKGENAQETLQTRLDSHDPSAPVTAADVQAAYDKEMENVSTFDLVTKAKVKITMDAQLKKVQESGKKHEADTEDVAKKTSIKTEILDIERQQNALREAIPAPSKETFPKIDPILNKVGKFFVAPDATKIDGIITQQINDNMDNLRKSGLDGEANKNVIREAVQELIKKFLEDDSLDLMASKEILKRNLKTFLERLNDIYDNKGGKAVFPNAIDMLINFSKYSKTDIVGSDGNLNKENLKEFLQFSGGTLESFLRDYPEYIRLEGRKKVLLDSTPERAKKTPEKPATTSGTPPGTPSQPNAPAGTPTAAPPATPDTKTPDGPSSFIEQILNWVSKEFHLPDGFTAIIAGWLGLKGVKALSSEITDLTKNLGGFSNVEKSLLNAMTEGLSSMPPFKDGGGKTNLLAKLTVLFKDVDKTKKVLTQKPQATSWADFLTTLDQTELQKLAAGTPLEAAAIAAILTPKAKKPGPTGPNIS